MEINRSVDAGSLKNQGEDPSSGCGCSRGITWIFHTLVTGSGL
jgi:hypothetical protein